MYKQAHSEVQALFHRDDDDDNDDVDDDDKCSIDPRWAPTHGNGCSTPIRDDPAMACGLGSEHWTE